MTEFLAKTANMSLLALAALPVLAVSVARAEPVRVQVWDLDLSQPAQVIVLNHRIDRAADRYCRGSGPQSLSMLDSCRAAFRDEAQDQVRKLRQQQQQARMVRPANG